VATVNLYGCGTGACQVHVSAYAGTAGVDAYDGAVSKIPEDVLRLGLSKRDLDRIGEKFREPRRPAELVTLELGGPGSNAPDGHWVWTARMIFVVLPRAYLDLFSLRLLAPNSFRVNATLSPGFCAAPLFLESESGSLAAEIAMNDLIVQSLAGVAIPNPDSIILHQYFDEDDFTPRNTRIKTEDVSGLR
jgi:hypothetical protein